MDDLPEIVQRLLRVQIENDAAIKLIQRYDCEQTLFYCDPPYPHDSRLACTHKFLKLTSLLFLLFLLFLCVLCDLCGSLKKEKPQRHKGHKGNTIPDYRDVCTR